MGCTYRACLTTTYSASPKLIPHLAKTPPRSVFAWPQSQFFGRPDCRWQHAQRYEGKCNLASSIHRKLEDLIYSYHSGHLFGGRGFIAGELNVSGMLLARSISCRPMFSRRLAAFYGVLLSSVTVGAGTAGISALVQEAAVESEGSLGDRELQTACARDLLAVLGGGEEAQAVGTPRAAALRSCIRPLLGNLSPIVESGGPTNAVPTAEEHLLTAPGEGSLVNATAIYQERVQARSTQSGGLQSRGSVLHSSRVIMQKLANQVSNRRVEGKTSSRNLGWQAADRGRLERGFAALIVRPPPEVSALVRAIDAERGTGGALRRALGPSHYKFPDCEGSTEARCQLARATTGQRFSKQVLSRYFALLFEAIAATAPSVGMPINLSRFDLFHGHFLYAQESRRFGILFHAREYPAEDPETFPINLGYCQRGSKVRYDETMTLRNLLWLAPREASSIRERAPGVLCALDTRPDGILGRELVAEGLQLVHTIYEGDFGVLLGDVNYLGSLKGRKLDQRLFIC